tara:strand:- start:24 stop:596 length:573 start_codon:yes stop_codon:yes gene_type:complete
MKPGLKTLITGITLFILGGFVIPFLLIIPLFFDESANQQFLIPGSREVTVEEPGRYYLWNDFQTVFDGKSFNRSENIPDGLEIIVTDDVGKTLKFYSDTSISSSSGSSSKNSIGYVEVSDSSKLSVSVSGDSEERVFSFSQSILPKMFLAIIGGGTVSILVAFVGFGVGVWGVVKLVRNKPGEQNVAGNA